MPTLMEILQNAELGAQTRAEADAIFGDLVNVYQTQQAPIVTDFVQDDLGNYQRRDFHGEGEYRFSPAQLERALRAKTGQSSIRESIFDYLLETTGNPSYATTGAVGADFAPVLGTAIGLEDAYYSGADIPEDVREGNYIGAANKGGQVALELGTALLSAIPAGRAIGGLIDTVAPTARADIAGLGRGILQADPSMVGEVFQRGGAPQSLSSAVINEPPKMKAYHGTPHEFDRFDSTKIGTGEGAQAYGHGLYFAENEKIAQHYKQKLSSVNSNPLEDALITMDGSPAAMAKFDSDLKQALSFASISDNPEIAARDFASFVGRRETPELVQAFREAMDNKGSMYEVAVEGSPDEFINYDARLDEQSDLVKSVLGTGEETAAARLQRAYTNEMFGGDMIGQDRATPTEVSQGLLSKGIKGIRYLDASSRGMGYKINLSRKGKPYETEPIEVGSRREAEALAKDYQEKGFDTNIEAIGNRNMVVFDDKLVEIVRKYGIAGAATLLGVSSADIEGALAQGMPDQLEKGLLD